MYDHIVVLETNAHVAYFEFEKVIRRNLSRGLLWDYNICCYIELYDDTKTLDKPIVFASIYDFKPHVRWSNICLK